MKCLALPALLKKLSQQLDFSLEFVVATCFLSLRFRFSTANSFEPSEMVLGTSRARGKSLITLLLMNQALFTAGEIGFWFMKLCAVTVKNLQHRISR